MTDLTTAHALSPRLLLHTADELAERIPAKWIVRDVLREQSLALWYGPRGGYKSFLALDLACHIAVQAPTHASWHGQAVTYKGLVIYLAAEGAGGMTQRLRAWSQYYNIHPRALHMAFVTEPAIITAESPDIELLITRIREQIGWIPTGPVPGRPCAYTDDGDPIEEGPDADEWPVLIVIDTLARCFVGNENAQEDMGRFIQGVDRLKREFRCSVLVIHHSGRADTTHARGSTVHEGAADTVFAINRAPGRPDGLAFTCDKMKDSAEGPPLAFAFQEVTVQRESDDPDPAPLTSVVIVDHSPAPVLDRVIAILQESKPGSKMPGCPQSGVVTLKELSRLLPDISDGTLRQTIRRYRDKRFTVSLQGIRLL